MPLNIRVISTWQMDKYILVFGTSKLNKNKAMVYKSGPMAPNMKVSGMKTWPLGEEGLF